MGPLARRAWAPRLQGHTRAFVTGFARQKARQGALRVAARDELWKPARKLAATLPVCWLAATLPAEFASVWERHWHFLGARHSWARACQGTQGKHRAARPRCACCPRPVTGAWSRLSPSVADAKGARPCSWGISSRPGRRTGRRSWRCWGSRAGSSGAGSPQGPSR